MVRNTSHYVKIQLLIKNWDQYYYPGRILKYKILLSSTNSERGKMHQNENNQMPLQTFFLL